MKGEQYDCRVDQHPWISKKASLDGAKQCTGGWMCPELVASWRRRNSAWHYEMDCAYNPFCMNAQFIIATQTYQNWKSSSHARLLVLLDRST